jgi:hypothetical protein
MKLWFLKFESAEQISLDQKEAEVCTEYAVLSSLKLNISFTVPVNFPHRLVDALAARGGILF